MTTQKQGEVAVWVFPTCTTEAAVLVSSSMSAVSRWSGTSTPTPGAAVAAVASAATEAALLLTDGPGAALSVLSSDGLLASALHPSDVCSGIALCTPFCTPFCTLLSPCDVRDCAQRCTAVMAG